MVAVKLNEPWTFLVQFLGREEGDGTIILDLDLVFISCCKISKDGVVQHLNIRTTVLVMREHCSDFW